MRKKIFVFFLSIAMGLGMISAGTAGAAIQTVSVSYRTHVQDIGWQDYVSDGAISGTTGQSKRLEAIQITVTGAPEIGITYSTHIQDIGWQSFVSDGGVSGTTGQGRRLEAIKIQLTGTSASLYDVYYQVHAQNFGWMDWAKNGMPAGTAGFSYRLEAIRIVIVAKDSAAPGPTENPFVDYGTIARVCYQTHVQDIGWQNYVCNGATSGTVGQARRLEAIRIKLENVAGGIEYRTHVQDYGWLGWVSNGEMSGTSGQSRRLEAIEIRLTGTAVDTYDIYYRVHAQNFGWMGWAKNGESAGTAGYAYRLEAIQIVLVEKGGAAPGSTARPFAAGMRLEINPSTSLTVHFPDTPLTVTSSYGSSALTSITGKPQYVASSNKFNFDIYYSGTRLTSSTEAPMFFLVTIKDGNGQIAGTMVATISALKAGDTWKDSYVSFTGFAPGVYTMEISDFEGVPG